MVRSSSRVLALLALVLLAGAFSACGGGKRVTGRWVYDEATTLGRAGESAATTRKRFQGMAITLEFYDDNSFALLVSGGPAPTNTTGSFRTGNGSMTLIPKVVDGRAAPAGEEITLAAPNRNLLEYPIASDRADLVPK